MKWNALLLLISLASCQFFTESGVKKVASQYCKPEFHRDDFFLQPQHFSKKLEKEIMTQNQTIKEQPSTQSENEKKIFKKNLNAYSCIIERITVSDQTAVVDVKSSTADIGEFVRRNPELYDVPKEKREAHIERLMLEQEFTKIWDEGQFHFVKEGGKWVFSQIPQRGGGNYWGSIFDQKKPGKNK